jgi:pimeloyl-ACP methyl ester carboxylesterase
MGGVEKATQVFRPSGQRSRIARSLGSRTGRAFTTGCLALIAAGLVNHAVGRRAERRHPPEGRFLAVDGVRLHYIERGAGPVIVLLHGNGGMARDFVLSGLFDLLAADHRVIAFDRPGSGYSERPRTRLWTASAQASVMNQALAALQVRRAVIVGHSWGTLVALAMAQRHPAAVCGLVLLAGYYYPTLRFDVALNCWAGLPVLGDLMRYTVLPVVGWLVAPIVYRRMFSPAPVAARFARRFPLSLSLRPWQLRATGEETALMIPAAAGLARRYPQLKLPAAVIAGRDDKLVDFAEQSRRLSRELPAGELCEIAGSGHMVHYSAPARIAGIVRNVARAAAP